MKFTPSICLEKYVNEPAGDFAFGEKETFTPKATPKYKLEYSINFKPVETTTTKANTYVEDYDRAMSII